MERRRASVIGIINLNCFKKSLTNDKYFLRTLRHIFLCDRNLNAAKSKQKPADLPKWQFGAYKSMFNASTFSFLQIL
ncbi:CLUMA_CG011431, isoform A [Clunio marinus]|uniref:CLUMA_CG011431, isoform A n=1 Tax=Clunio marinus TaxID=568069 RepID=A0A1J1IG93_9DIPT|nr:CLUMA_CG011431, isoform A [Clunio marinus]